MKNTSKIVLGLLVVLAISLVTIGANLAPEAIWNKIFDSTNNAVQVSIVASSGLAVAGNLSATGTLNVTGQSTMGDAQVDGWAIFAPTIVSAASYTISSADKAMNYVVNISDTEAGSVFLPSGAANGTTLCIADGDLNAGSNNVTIRRQGTDTINEGTTYALNANGESICVVYQSSVTDWHIMSGYAE